jgi:hypothetical protein
MPMGHTYSFNRATDYSTVFMVDGDKVAYLADPVFLPVGTLVTLTDGREAEVTSTRLDVSNESGYAMVYVTVRVVSTESFYESHDLTVV